MKAKNILIQSYVRFGQIQKSNNNLKGLAVLFGDN